jgi:hypothetical protein
MKTGYEVVLGTLRDSMWHVGLYKDGNCLRWASFASRGEAEKWLENPSLPARDKSLFAFSAN